MNPTHLHEPLRTGVAGAGVMGRNHARVLSEMRDIDLALIFDPDAVVAEGVAAAFGAQSVTTAADFVAAGLQAAVVATPNRHHAELGVALLEAGVHVLVEKPIAADLKGAQAMIDAARANDRVLMVGHVERFNPASEALQKIVRPRFVEVHRLSPFPNRSLDIDVILDLMIHDLDLLVALDTSKPAQIDAVGVPVLTDRVDIANVRIRFESGLIANLTASRVSVEKTRKFRVFGSRLYASCDFLTRQAQIAQLVMGAGGAPEIRMETIGSGPGDPEGEPLRRQAKAFVTAVVEKSRPVVSGEAGLAVLGLAKEILDKVYGRA